MKQESRRGFCKLCMRGTELAKVFAWHSVEQSFSDNSRSWLAKVARRRDFRDRPHTYRGVRSYGGCLREDFILFPVSRPFRRLLRKTHPVREKYSDVKRRLLRSIFARCTFLNANRARENSWDFIAGASIFYITFAFLCVCVSFHVLEYLKVHFCCLSMIQYIRNVRSVWYTFKWKLASSEITVFLNKFLSKFGINYI